ncbi:MAG: hypothetical protein HQK54_06875 [Oligoflexales bacterium]|nr:hypothetical protein [Oligoflexales bacterium]
MFWKKTVYLFLLCVLIGFLINAASPKTSWETISNSDGIIVSRRIHPGTDMQEMKGVGKINVKLPKMIALLSDSNSMPYWIEGCIKSKLLKRNFTEDSFDMEINEYVQTLWGENELPWPFQNRDYVLEAKLSFVPPAEGKKESLIITSTAIRSDEVPKNEKLVRIEKMRVEFIISPTDDQDVLEMQFLVLLDPGGHIPTWLSDLVARHMPLKTFQKIRKLVEKPDYDRKIEKLVIHHMSELSKKYNLSIPH